MSGTLKKTSLLYEEDFFQDFFFFQEEKLAWDDVSSDKEWQEEHGAVAARGKQQGKNPSLASPPVCLVPYPKLDFRVGQ